MEPLSNSLADPQPDWRRLLPREAFAEIILILRGALPPPVSDEPADLVRRDRAAMAAVGALQPVNGAEGRLAAQFVAADAWALDCLRLAGERRLELEIARKCRAQAMSMMREGKSALRMLLRLQAARRAIGGNVASSVAPKFIHTTDNTIKSHDTRRETDARPWPPSSRAVHDVPRD